MFQSSEAGHTGHTGCGDMVFHSMKYAQFPQREQTIIAKQDTTSFFVWYLVTACDFIDSINFSLITFNWFHTIFVDSMPSNVSCLMFNVLSSYTLCFI